MNKIRTEVDAAEVFTMLSKTNQSFSLGVSLAIIMESLARIAKRSAELQDPILIEELAVLNLIKLSDKDRKSFLKECRKNLPDLYDYEI
jgi:hypothetical protein